MRDISKGVLVAAMSMLLLACASQEGTREQSAKVEDPKTPASMFQSYHVFGPPTN